MNDLANIADVTSAAHDDECSVEMCRLHGFRRLEDLRHQIEAGNYLTDDKLDALADQLFDVVCNMRTYERERRAG